MDIRKALTEDDKITSTYIRMHTQLDKVAPMLFMERTDLFKRLQGMVIANMDTFKTTRSDEFMKSLKHDLISSLFIAAYTTEMNRIGATDTLKSLNNSLIYSSVPGENVTDVINRLRKLKGKKANYFVNQFLRAIPANDIANKDRVYKAMSNNWAKLSDQRQIQLRDSFVQLITTPATRVDGISLFNYLLVKDGGQFKNGSFVKFVAPFVFKDLFDQGAKVKEMLALKQYNDKSAIDTIGMTWHEFMDKFIINYSTHVDNKLYIHSLRTSNQSGVTKPVYLENGTWNIDMFNGIDSKGKKLTEEQTKQLVSNIEQIESTGLRTISVDSGKKNTNGKPLYHTHIQFPYVIKVGDTIYKLDTPGIAKGMDTHTGTKATYSPTESTGARNTYKAGGVNFGALPKTSELLRTDMPQSPEQHNPGYSPVQNKEVKQEVKPQENIVVPLAPQSVGEAVQQLAHRHNVYIANVSGKAVAYRDNKQIDLPQGVHTPKELLQYLDNEKETPSPVYSSMLSDMGYSGDIDEFDVHLPSDDDVENGLMDCGLI